jgi:hypothetical protein
VAMVYDRVECFCSVFFSFFSLWHYKFIVVSCGFFSPFLLLAFSHSAIKISFPKTGKGGLVVIVRLLLLFSRRFHHAQLIVVHGQRITCIATAKQSSERQVLFKIGTAGGQDIRKDPKPPPGLGRPPKPEARGGSVPTQSGKEKGGGGQSHTIHT